MRLCFNRPNAGFGGFPLIAGDFNQLNIMRFAPAIAFQPTSNLSFGLAGIVDYGSLDDLTLESPQELGLGLAFSFGKFLIEADGKWINWGDAEGYEDFDWEDQYVFAIGAQYEPIQNLFVRVGYNYADHPLKDNDGFDGTKTASVQGKSLPNYYYETFRMIGFPALVKHHITLGIGYEFSETVSMNLGYVHAFEESFDDPGH